MGMQQGEKSENSKHIGKTRSMYIIYLFKMSLGLLVIWEMK